MRCSCQANIAPRRLNTAALTPDFYQRQLFSAYFIRLRAATRRLCDCQDRNA
jgi:hypothetical protein